MSQSLYQISLPALQRRLDALAPGARLALALSDYRRLFGSDDVGAARLAHFAQGHGCGIRATPSLIEFEKSAKPR